MKILRSLPTALAACVALAMVTAPPVAAVPEQAPLSWAALDTSDGQDAGLTPCVDEAHRTRPEAWTCMGGVLRVTADGRGKTTDAVYTVTEGAPAFPRARAAVPGRDDYDSWCENGTICSRQINDYTAEVKGNGAYGDSKGVIGTFDVVYRQSFDGNLPRWRTLIDWDSGPEINPGTWTNTCRVNLSGRPDDYCGRNNVNLTSINATAQRAWWPSGDRWSYNAQRLTGSGKYHDDHEGEFTAFGHRQLFKAGVLHTGRWTKCNTRTGCQYYQVPWQP